MQDSTYQNLCEKGHYFVTDTIYNRVCSCGSRAVYTYVIDDLSGHVESSRDYCQKFKKVGVDNDGRDVYEVVNGDGRR